MKRSHINEILKEGDAFIRSFGYVMPPFADWTPERMKSVQTDAPGVLEGSLGWDVTDYGAGRYDEMGLFLFTARNGDAAQLASGKGMLYAEKIMISLKDQLSPMHRHIVKAEDIINRGGGTLVIELFAQREDGSIDDQSDITVPSDGRMITLPPGGKLSLRPGESVTLMPGVWHAFWAEGADTLIGEVSTVNDDRTDNVFREPIGRFSDIEEDVEPWRLLVSDYDKFIGAA